MRATRSRVSTRAVTEQIWAGAAAPGVITVLSEGANRVLCLAGEIDLGAVEAFNSRVGCNPSPVDVIDAQAVTFIGSVGVALMLRWVKASTEAGAPPVLRRSSPALDRVLKLTHLDEAIRRPDR